MKKKPKAKKDKSILIQMDMTPNLLKLRGQEESIKETMRQELEKDLDKRISRYKELPAIMVQVKSEEDEYIKLLYEARRLYIEGKFYSCIAMCGVTSERIGKDILRRIILIKKLDKTDPSKFSKHLDRISMDVVRELIIVAGVVDSSIRNAFVKLASLRDKYVHARSVESQKDAQKAIEYLHEIVGETVSIFKRYRIQQGKLVSKRT